MNTIRKMKILLVFVMLLITAGCSSSKLSSNWDFDKDGMWVALHDDTSNDQFSMLSVTCDKDPQEINLFINSGSTFDISYYEDYIFEYSTVKIKFDSGSFYNFDLWLLDEDRKSGYVEISQTEYHLLLLSDTVTIEYLHDGKYVDMVFDTSGAMDAAKKMIRYCGIELENY